MRRDKDRRHKRRDTPTRGASAVMTALMTALAEGRTGVTISIDDLVYLMRGQTRRARNRAAGVAINL